MPQRNPDYIDKDPLRDRFERVPYIQHNRGDSWGLLGFDGKLTEEDIQFVKDNCIVEGKTIDWSIPPGASFARLLLPHPTAMLNLTPQRTRSTSSKQTEQTMQLPGSSRAQNPAVVVGATGVVDVADAEVVEAVEAVAEMRNEGTSPPTRRVLVMKSPVRRGNATLNQMAVHRPG